MAKNIELLEEHLLALFDVSAQQGGSAFLGMGLESYGKWLDHIESGLREQAEVALAKLSSGDKAKIAGRIRLRLAARVKLCFAQAVQEFTANTNMGSQMPGSTMTPAANTPETAAVGHFADPSDDDWFWYHKFRAAGVLRDNGCLSKSKAHIVGFRWFPRSSHQSF